MIPSTLDHMILRPFPLDVRPSPDAGLGTKIADWLGLGGQPVKRRFDVLRMLGRGASAEVYLVRDRRRQNEFALKVYFPGLPTEYALGDPRPCEGEIGAQLDHPRILGILEHGLTDSGQYYVLSEYIAGTTLDQVIRNGSWAADRLTIVRQVASAVEAFHTGGFLHGDICPANFLAAHDGRELKLFDFAAAMPVDQHFDRTTLRISRTDYLPPELLHCRTLSKAVDMFEFGVTVYELIAGRQPWEAVSSKSSVSRTIRRPDDIRQHVPAIDEDLARAIHQLLVPEPSKRTPSAQAFLKAIDHVEACVWEDMLPDAEAATVVVGATS